MNTLSRFGMSISFFPSPYPIFPIVMAGIGPKLSQSVDSIAAPVGVTSSVSISMEYMGMPVKSSAAAGAGTGMIPCLHSTNPMPVFTLDAANLSMFSISMQIAHPTMSTMESKAPTS